MGFPFLKAPRGYIGQELKSRKDPFVVSKMRPWISATSNLGPYGKTLDSTMYSNVVDGGNTSYDINGNIKYKPNPIITDFSIDFSTNGTLRNGTLKIKCFSISQLEEIQKYFMEPGISIFVQWGWNHTATNGKKVNVDGTGKETQLKYYRRYDNLIAKRDAELGCYDNLSGVITGGTTSISDDSYEVVTKITSIGELNFGNQISGQQKVNLNNSTTKGSPTKYSSKDIQDIRTSGNKLKVNWCYFFNQLPDQFRNNRIKSWGENPTNVDYETDFINYDELYVEEVKTETGAQWFGLKKTEFTFLGKQFKAEDSESPISSKKYLKFSTFVGLLNEISPTIKADNDIISFKIDIGTRQAPLSIVGVFHDIFSVNDNAFIPNSNAYNWYNENGYFQYAKGTSTQYVNNSVADKVSLPLNVTSVTIDGETLSFPAKTIGWLGDVYIENDIALAVLKSTSEPIKDQLDVLLDSISEATDRMWNFQIREDNTNGYKLRIVDANVQNLASSLSPLTLVLTGPESVFLSANFEMDIPKEISSQVVLSKASEEMVSNQPGIRALFSKAKDIVLTDNVGETTKEDIKTPPPPKESETDALDNWKGFRKESRICIQPTISANEGATGDIVTKYLMPGVSTNVEAFNRIRKQRIQSKEFVSGGAALGIDFKFTVLGISGFIVGDLIRIKGLPQQYSSGAGAFMVKEVRHTVNDKMWTTEVVATYRPYINP